MWLLAFPMNKFPPQAKEGDHGEGGERAAEASAGQGPTPADPALQQVTFLGDDLRICPAARTFGHLPNRLVQQLTNPSLFGAYEGSYARERRGVVPAPENGS